MLPQLPRRRVTYLLLTTHPLNEQLYGTYIIFSMLTSAKKFTDKLAEHDDEDQTHGKGDGGTDAAQLQLLEPAPKSPSTQLEVREGLPSVVVVKISSTMSVLCLSGCNVPEKLATRYADLLEVPVLLPTLIAELYAEGYAIASQANDSYTLTRV